MQVLTYCCAKQEAGSEARHAEGCLLDGRGLLACAALEMCLAEVLPACCCSSVGPLGHVRLLIVCRAHLLPHQRRLEGNDPQFCG